MIPVTQKFISIHKLFPTILLQLHYSSKKMEFPFYVMYAMFMFFHQCILSILQQKVTDHIESVLMNYLCIFNEMLLMDEAQSILVSSSFYFSALIQLLHIPTISIINATILLFNRICENNPVTADIIAQCFIEEMNITSMNNSELSLSILICLLNEPIDVTIKMNVVKFLAVLIYSAKSLASRIKVRNCALF